MVGLAKDVRAPLSLVMLTLLAVLLVAAASGYAVRSVVRAARTGPEYDPGLREMRDRLERLEQSMEGVSAEVERLTESQRFLTSLLEDRARTRPALPGVQDDPPQ